MFSNFIFYDYNKIIGAKDFFTVKNVNFFLTIKNDFREIL